MLEHTHPGTIVYVDGSTQQEIRRLPAAAVSDSQRFAVTAQGPVPVVLVVTFPRGEHQISREYGPSGRLLRSTLNATATQI